MPVHLRGIKHWGAAGCNELKCVSIVYRDLVLKSAMWLKTLKIARDGSTLLQNRLKTKLPLK